MRFPVLCLALGLLISPVCAEPRPAPTPAPSFEKMFPKSLAQMNRIENPDVRALMKAAIKRSGVFDHPTLSPDGKTLIYQDFANTLGFTRGGDRVKALPIPPSKRDKDDLPIFPFSLAGASFSPDGKLVVVTKWETSPRFIDEDRPVLFDARTWKMVRLFPPHTNTIVSMAFSRDGRRLLVGDAGGAARIYDVASGKTLTKWHYKNYLKSVIVGWVQTDEGETATALTALSWNGDARTSAKDAEASREEPAQLWNIEGDYELTRFPLVLDARDAAFSVDGSHIAIMEGGTSAPRPNRIFITRWADTSLSSSRVFPLKAVAFISSLCWTPDGKTLLAFHVGIGVNDGKSVDGEWFRIFDTSPQTSRT